MKQIDNHDIEDPTKSSAQLLTEEDLINQFEQLLQKRKRYKKLGIEPNDLDYLLLEYLSCAADPIYFIENYIRIEEPEGFVQMKLYPKQKLIIQAALQKKHIIILGSRQTGKSTVLRLLMLWLARFVRKYKIAFTQQKAQYGVEALRVLKEFYMNLPLWLRADKLAVDNAYKKVLAETNSYIQFVVVNPQNPDGVGRSLSADSVMIDEAAFIPKIKQAYTALKPVLSRRFPRLERAGIPYFEAIVSTPHGITGDGEWFFRMWYRSLLGETNFFPILFHWREVPEYDEKWYEQATKDLDERERLQEYELVFVPPETAFLDVKLAHRLEQNIKSPIETVELAFGEARIYKHFEPDKFYLIGVDVADRGSDEAAIVVTEFETDEVVAVYNNRHVLSLDFVADILAILKLYPRAVIGIEANSLGSPLIQLLMRLPGVDSKIWIAKEYRRKKFSDKLKKAGITTSNKTRPLIISALYRYLVDNAEKVNDYALVLSLIGLERRGNRVEAASGSRDDLAFALAFTAYLKQYGDIEDYLIFSSNVKINWDYIARALGDLLPQVQADYLRNISDTNIASDTNSSFSSSDIFDNSNEFQINKSIFGVSRGSSSGFSRSSKSSFFKAGKLGQTDFINLFGSSIPDGRIGTSRFGRSKQIGRAYTKMLDGRSKLF